jgi:hypothetical protein
MFAAKGYRARQAAAMQRKDRGRVSEYVRAQRAAALEPKIAESVHRAKDKHEQSEGYAAESVIETSDVQTVDLNLQQDDPPIQTSDDNPEGVIFEDDEEDQPEGDIETADVQPKAESKLETANAKPAKAGPKSGKKKK